MPLGVPWKRRSLAYTSAEISAGSNSLPQWAASARTSAVATAAPLPMPLATGIVERMLIFKSGSGPGRWPSFARTLMISSLIG